MIVVVRVTLPIFVFTVYVFIFLHMIFLYILFMFTKRLSFVNILYLTFCITSTVWDENLYNSVPILVEDHWSLTKAVTINDCLYLSISPAPLLAFSVKSGVFAGSFPSPKRSILHSCQLFLAWAAVSDPSFAPFPSNAFLVTLVITDEINTFPVTLYCCWFYITST